MLVEKERVVTYYFSKKLQIPLGEAIGRLIEALKQERFGILTDIDVQQTLKKKLDIDFRPYRILGPATRRSPTKRFRLRTRSAPCCNVIVQDVGSGLGEVSAVDPVASMAAIDNAKLGELAETVRAKLRSVIESL